jgi:hypothetical protein
VGSVFVMELVGGEDLAAGIARRPMSIDDALPIARQIAEALEPRTRWESSIAISSLPTSEYVQDLGDTVYASVGWHINAVGHSIVKLVGELS